MIKRTPLEKWIARKIGSGSQALNRSDLETYQLQKLQKNLRLVKEKSPFYQQKLKDFSADIETIQHWHSIPFTTAEELQNNGLKMLIVPQGDIQRVVTLDTSGTSGTPKRCFFTKADQELTIDFFGVGMSCLVSKIDKVLILLPGERPGSVGDLLCAGLKRKKIKSLKYGAVKDVSSVTNLIHEQKITALVGAPSQILALARRSQVLGYPLPSSIKSVLLSTDHAPQAIIQSLEKTWGCEVFNHLGMTEMGLGGGVDCQAHYGMHMREADLFFEIIDPITGMVLPDGNYGEVVFTTLTREGMPLIRYKTGDISRFLPEPCPCGTTLKTMDWIRYRYNDTLQFEQGLLTLADLDEALFSLSPVLDFRVEVLNQQPILLSITVFVNRDDFLISEIDTALRTIPALENALAKDVVKLHLDLKLGLPDYFGSLAKPKIQLNTSCEKIKYNK